MRNKVKNWQPFERAELLTKPEDFDNVRTNCAKHGLTEEQTQDQIRRLQNDVVFMNNIYQVNICECEKMENWPDMLHLSIKRRDKNPIRDWRDFQRIKNELIGPDHEAVELYPAEARLVDTANQYHLWVLADPEKRFPFGWHGRVTCDDSPIGGKQRPLGG